MPNAGCGDTNARRAGRIQPCVVKSLDSYGVKVNVNGKSIVATGTLPLPTVPA
jgi:hypothetical protein